MTLQLEVTATSTHHTHTQVGGMIDKLQKAIMIVRMCRTVVFAATNIVNRAALDDLLLHHGTWRGSPTGPLVPLALLTHTNWCIHPLYVDI